MLNEIQNELLNIENSKKVKILYAVESGSRAWGFASPDSDYDIRFIYKHPSDYYLSLWEKPDVIEFMTDKNLDGSGWDLPKALRLLAKSNAPLIEWLFSPIVYNKKDEFLTQMQTFAKECFSPIAAMHHYLGTTKNFLEECNLEKVKLKSYFYALRTTLASQCIAETKTVSYVRNTSFGFICRWFESNSHSFGIAQFGRAIKKVLTVYYLFFKKYLTSVVVKQSIGRATYSKM